MKRLFILILSCNLALADNVTSIQKGTPAPYDGVLFDVEAGNNLRGDKLDLLYLRRENETLKKNDQIYIDRLKNKDEEIDRLSKKDNSFLGIDNGFISGIVVTILVTFAVKKATQ